MNRTNTQIIEDAISDIRVLINGNSEFKVFIEGTLGRELSDWELITMYVTSKLWQEHSEAIKLSDIAYIRTAVGAIFANNPMM